jgi:ribulose-phosphate 3-epimerase
MQQYRILPAVIAQTQEELDHLLSRIEGLFDWVMLDFMDGVFVPTSSLQFDFKLPRSFKYEAHLMVNQPKGYLLRLKNCVETVILHVESKGFKTTLKEARLLGFEVSAAINPSTKLSKILAHISELDRILVMTVEPGQYGAPFVPISLKKVREIRNVAPNIPIEVDGAMNPETIKLAKDAGASIFASGSYLIKSPDISKAKRTLVSAILDG